MGWAASTRLPKAGTRDGVLLIGCPRRIGQEAALPCLSRLECYGVQHDRRQVSLHGGDCAHFRGGPAHSNAPAIQRRKCVAACTCHMHVDAPVGAPRQRRASTGARTAWNKATSALSHGAVATFASWMQRNSNDSVMHGRHHSVLAKFGQIRLKSPRGLSSTTRTRSKSASMLVEVGPGLADRLWPNPSSVVQRT